MLGWAAAALVLWLVVGEVRERWGRDKSEALPVAAGAASAVASATPSASAAALAAPYAASVPVPASAASGVSASARIAELEEQIDKLEDDVERARRRSRGLRAWVADSLHDIGAGLGWGIVYFSLLPAWWQGQTLGKKLLRLRVVELSGQPLTVMRCQTVSTEINSAGLGLAQ